MGRRWLLIGGAVLGALLCGLVFVFVIYGHVGAWVVRSRVVPKLEARLGREVTIGDIDVRRGHAVLTDLVVKGPNDGEEPLVRIERVEAELAFWPSLTGNVELGLVRVEGMKVAARRGEGGDNVSDILDRLRGGGEEGAGGGGGGGGLGRLRPKKLELRRSFVQVRDAAGVTLVATGITADAAAGEPLTVVLGDLALVTDLGPHASAAGVVITADPADLVGSAEVKVGGGEVFLWKGMTLTGVTGTVAQGEAPGRLEIDLRGGYGGAEGTLWQAAGWIAPLEQRGNLQMKADRFTFDRIAPVLADSMVRDFDDTSIDAALEVTLDPRQLTFAGQVNLSGLNVFHEKLSDQVVRDVSFHGDVAGSYDRAARVLAVDRANLETRGVAYGLAGRVELAGGTEHDGSRRPARRLQARIIVPKAGCQQVLESIPKELVPRLAGFQLSGTFATDLVVEVDWADLQATVLDGSVGIRGCKVKKAPKDLDARRLETSFEHEIEFAPDKWETVVIGPENPTFVPLDQVSPYLLKSFMTTEDSSFYKHRGFITREFRTALIKNLEAGDFKYGASSISMQLVKNVFLHRDKTLARKFQELFLTWYIESVLEKDRIFEIYVNAIEYGPGLYGIYPASYQYFGVHPRDLIPVQAAFFSSILPAPKRRYKQFCRDKLTGWSVKKIERILKTMHQRGRLTSEELQEALVTPLEFQPNKQGFCDKKIPEWNITPERRAPVRRTGAGRAP